MMMMSSPKKEPFYAEATTTAAPTISESTWKELNNMNNNWRYVYKSNGGALYRLENRSKKYYFSYAAGTSTRLQEFLVQTYPDSKGLIPQRLKPGYLINMHDAGTNLRRTEKYCPQYIWCFMKQ